MNSMNRVFIDIDGTLCPFDTNAVFEADGTAPYPSYFLEREAFKEAKNFVFLLARCGFEIYILTARKEIYKEDTIKWLCKNVSLYDIKPQNIIFTPYGEDKSLYVPGGIRENDILIDDNTPNLKRWKGIGIKALNGINGQGGTWINGGGNFINMLAPHYSSVNAVVKIAKGAYYYE